MGGHANHVLPPCMLTTLCHRPSATTINFSSLWFSPSTCHTSPSASLINAQLCSNWCQHAPCAVCPACSLRCMPSMLPALLCSPFSLRRFQTWTKKYCDNVHGARRVVTVRHSTDGVGWSDDWGCLDKPQTSEHCKSFNTTAMVHPGGIQGTDDPPELGKNSYR